MDGFGIFSLVSRPLILVYSLIAERPKISIRPRFIPEVQSFVMEVVNTGRKPMTITSVGITGIPWGSRNANPGHVWMCDDSLPRRIQERDCAYFVVWWGKDVVDRDKASYAWVRDITGKIVTSPLPNAEMYHESANQSILSEDERAKLFNLQVQRENIMATKLRLAHIEAQVDFYTSLAAIREAESRKQDPETSGQASQ